MIKKVEVNRAAGSANASTILTTKAGTVISRPITTKVAPVSPNDLVKDRIKPVRRPPFTKGNETFSIAS
jgi:hypothetical protein